MPKFEKFRKNKRDKMNKGKICILHVGVDCPFKALRHFIFWWEKYNKCVAINTVSTLC